MRQIIFIVLVIVTCLSFSCNHSKPPLVTEPSEECTPEQLKTSTKISTEEYWQIQIERLESTRDHYQAILVVAKKYGGDTPEAREEILALQKKNRDRIQVIFTSRGFEPSDLYSMRSCRTEILMSRQQYLEDHPELKAKYNSLTAEIRGLREQIKPYFNTLVPAAQVPEQNEDYPD